MIAELADQLPTDTATVTRRRHLSFAGTIDPEEDFAERSEEILDWDSAESRSRATSAS